MTALYVQTFPTPVAESPYKLGRENTKENHGVSVKSRITVHQDRTSTKIPETLQAKTQTVREERRVPDRHKQDALRELNTTKNKLQSPKDLKSSVLGSGSVAADCFAAENIDMTEREYFIRCMVIGAEGTGKHSLLSANFSDENLMNGPKERNGVDLVMKTTLNYNTTTKYHFWIRTLINETEIQETIWKTYYNWVTTFIFVYDITKKESFDALKRVVRKILKVVPQNKFLGILIGTKADLDNQREVDYEEAAKFKSRYNFTHFVETSSSLEKETPQLLSLLNPKLKLMFEAI